MYSIKSELDILELIESDLRRAEKDSKSESLLKKFENCHHSAIDLKVLINQLNSEEKSITKLKKKVYNKTTILCKNLGELFAQLHE